MDMEKIVRKTIKKYNLISDGDTLVVAVSGGADSMALLHFFKKHQRANISLIVAHVNHAVRVDSGADEMLVKKTADSWALPYESLQLSPIGENRMNFHQYAREARYEFFVKIARKYGATRIAVAHHADDHLETFIDRMMSKNTPRSLMGILPKSKMQGLEVIRPLIDVKKFDIYAYCHEYGVTYREDLSNSSDDYTRNRIRRHIVPAVVEEAASVHSHVRALSDALALDEDFFSCELERLWHGVILVNNVCNMKRDFLMRMHASLSSRLIRRIFGELGSENIASIHVSEILDLIHSEKPNVSKYFPGNVKCEIAYHDVTFSLGERVDIGDYVFEIVPNERVILPNGMELKAAFATQVKKNAKLSSNSSYLCYNEICAPIFVRGRNPGDKISLVNQIGSKKVKEIMIEAKIPKILRDSWPIVVDANGKILWIPGLKKSAYCHEFLDSEGLLVEFILNS